MLLFFSFLGSDHEDTNREDGRRRIRLDKSIGTNLRGTQTNKTLDIQAQENITWQKAL